MSNKNVDYTKNLWYAHVQKKGEIRVFIFNSVDLIQKDAFIAWN